MFFTNCRPVELEKNPLPGDVGIGYVNPFTVASLLEVSREVSNDGVTPKTCVDSGIDILNLNILEETFSCVIII